MDSIEKSIVVDVPLRTAYNQWTQFEEFPSFMEGITEVRQIDDKHLHWRADVLGKTVDWTADITEQIPDQKIAWQSTSGAKNWGSVSFAPQSAASTRLTLNIGYEPEGATERAGSAVGLVANRVERDLKRFKKFIEERGRETGEWRGTIPEGGSAQ